MTAKINSHIPQPTLKNILPVVNSVTRKTTEELSVALTQLKQLDDTQFIGGQTQRNAFMQTLQDQMNKKININ